VQLRLLALLGVEAAALLEQCVRQAHFANVLEQADIAEQLDLRRLELQEAAEGGHVDRHVERVRHRVFPLFCAAAKAAASRRGCAARSR